MNIYDWLADKFRAYERRKQVQFWRDQQALQQERCPHRHLGADGLGDIICLDCGQDQTE